MKYDFGADSENQRSPIRGKQQDIWPILTSPDRETKRDGHMTKVTGVCQSYHSTRKRGLLTSLSSGLGWVQTEVI